MSAQQMRTLFVTLTVKAFSETTVAIALAEQVVAKGGIVSFLASPSAGKIVRTRFRDRVHLLTPNLETNLEIWRQIVKQLKPDIIVFSEFFVTWFPGIAMSRDLGYPAESPLMNWRWLRELQAIDAALIVIDTAMINSLMAQEIAEKGLSTYSLGPVVWRLLCSIFQRMSVMLPCPLHEPSPIQGRRGITYPSFDLPFKIDPKERSRIRARFLGVDQQEEACLILFGISRWSRTVAKRRGLRLYDRLGELLGIYLSNIRRPVTLVCVGDEPLLRPAENRNLRVANVNTMPPADYEKLLICSDLLITLDDTAQSQGKALGNVPSLVLVNSYSLDELLKRVEHHNPVRRFVIDMEQMRPGSIYPFIHYPLLAKRHLLTKEPTEMADPSFPGFFHYTIRRGDIHMSPYLRAEIYGGHETEECFRRVLCDSAFRQYLQRQENEYIERQKKLDDGPTALERVLAGDVAGHTLLDPS